MQGHQSHNLFYLRFLDYSVVIWSDMVLEKSKLNLININRWVLLYRTAVPCTFVPLTGPHAFGPKNIYLVPKILMKQPHDCSY